MTSHKSARTLILGLCSYGPYRYAKDNIQNPTVRWINWGYNVEYVHPEVLEDLRAKKIAQGTKIAFCVWNLSKESVAEILRAGVIDHISYKGSYLSFTVFLSEQLSGTIDLHAQDHFLCRYVDKYPFKIGAE